MAEPLPQKVRRSHGRVTLREVAAHAGVSAMTVSRALRQQGSVSATVAERIQAALDATGYTPNKSAGLLASGQSHIVAALIPNIANSIFAETIQGLSDTLQSQGLELLLAVTSYSQQREEEQLRALLGWAPRALVVTGTDHTRGALRMMRKARDQGVPVLEMWDQSPRSEFLQVGFNHAQAGAAMFHHLRECGFRDLAFVQSNNDADLRAHERCSGFMDAARAAGVPVRLLRPVAGEPLAAGRQLAATVLGQTTLPQAWAFTNDLFAGGVLLQALSMGLRIPHDLALLGFGDMPLAAQLGQGLSTLAVPRYAIGQQTGRAISAVCQGHRPDLALQLEALAPRLIVRSSTMSGSCPQ